MSRELESFMLKTARNYRKTLERERAKRIVETARLLTALEKIPPGELKWSIPSTARSRNS
jgi:hypothetical protein